MCIRDRLDIEPSELGRNYPNVCSLWGDAMVSLKELIKLINTNSMQGNQVWLERVQQVVDEWHSEVRALRYSEAVPMRPERICKEIEAVLPSDSILVSDTGHAGIWSGTHIELHHPSQTYIRAAGSLGWGLPAAIGAKAARPDVPVVDIAGDGSFNMTENSLATSVLEDLPVIVFLINNFSLGMVAQWQRTFYEKRMIGIDLKNCPDYVKLAESYGAQGIRAQSMDELEKAIKSGLNSDVATVIDIPIDPEEDVLPFVAPGTSLKAVSYTHLTLPTSDLV